MGRIKSQTLYLASAAYLHLSSCCSKVFRFFTIKGPYWLNLAPRTHSVPSWLRMQVKRSKQLHPDCKPLSRRHWAFKRVCVRYMEQHCLSRRCKVQTAQHYTFLGASWTVWKATNLVSRVLLQHTSYEFQSLETIRHPFKDELGLERLPKFELPAVMVELF